MFHLFPAFQRGRIGENARETTSRALKIYELLYDSSEPCYLRTIQGMLVVNGETWAAGKSGYLAIWGIVTKMRDAGLVVKSDQGGGVTLVSKHEQVQTVCNALLDLLADSLPSYGDLWNLRSVMSGVVMRYMAADAAWTQND